MDQIDYLISKGMHLFPLRPDTKRPYEGSWPAQTSNDPTTLRAWHAGIATHKSYSKSQQKEVEPDFTGCIWGVNLGKSDLCAYDIDVADGKPGYERFMALKKAKGGYVDTFLVQTPSGGWHIITKGKCASKNNFEGTKDDKSGMDIKSDGGYIVAPGTKLSDGREYKIIKDLPFAPTPQWLLDMRGQRDDRKAVEALVGEEMTEAQRLELEDALSHIPPDMGNDDWVKIGQAIHRKYPGEHDGLDLFERWSRGDFHGEDIPASYREGECAKRWPSFTHGDDGKDVTISTLFFMARESGWQGQSAAAAFADRTPVQSYDMQVKDALAKGNPTLPVVPGEIDLISKILTMDQVMEMPPHIPDPVIENMFEPGDKFCIIGKSKTKKTYFMFNMACCIAAGNGHFLGMSITKPRRVLVIQYEVQDGHFLNRARSVARALKLDKSVMLQNLGVLSLMGEQWNWPAIHKAVDHFGTEVVIFDPIYKMFEGDENSAEAWRLLLGQYDLIRKRTGAAVGYVHHDAKGNAGDRDMVDRGSGSGMLARDYDAGITLTKHATIDKATVVEFLARNFREPDPVTITWNDFPACIADPNVEARAKCSADMNKAVRKPITDNLWNVLAERYRSGTVISADKMAKDTVESAEFMRLSSDDKMGYKTLRDRLVDLITCDMVVGVGSESVVFEGHVDESTGKAVAQVHVRKLGDRL